MTLETKYGVPTVALHTDKFDRVVRSVAQVAGMPGLRQAFVPQPVMGKTPRELRAYVDGETVGAIPAEFLTDEAPRYDVARQPRPPAEPAPAPAGPPADRSLLDLLASPNVRSRAWIFRRYDHLVGSRTVRRPGRSG